MSVLLTSSLVLLSILAIILLTSKFRIHALIAHFLGAGSMVISHASDSYFWVVSNFAGVDPTINLKVYSTSTAVMGTVVFACVWLVSLIVF